jgi:hypothetical protein
LSVDVRRRWLGVSCVAISFNVLDVASSLLNILLHEQFAGDDSDECRHAGRPSSVDVQDTSRNPKLDQSFRAPKQRCL